jgi:hypothetical protein
MKTTLRFIATTFIVCFLLQTLPAQDFANEHQATFSIETDPATFLLSGYALHFRMKPAEISRLVIGAGTYSMKLPTPIVNLNTNNKNEGWDVRIKNAYSLYAEYYFKEAFSKFFAGVQAGIQNYSVTKTNEGVSSKYRTITFMPMIGYTWLPFNFPLYIKPWMGVGYNAKIAGTTLVGSNEYEVPRLMPFFTFHVGYKFGQEK